MWAPTSTRNKWGYGPLLMTGWDSPCIVGMSCWNLLLHELGVIIDDDDLRYRRYFMPS